MKADIGMIGMGVMGSNLARNMVSKGFTVSCYDWNETLRKNFAAKYKEGFVHAVSLKEFVESIERPRKIMMMIKAGVPVDSVINELLPLLDPGDVLIDGGNSEWEDTERRIALCEKNGLLFVGSGVSGGEEGALNSPALMPGGSKGAWELIRPVFEAIAARTPEGDVCVDWIGAGGAGHFVKMVHNGIEYGDMQMICETYQVMRGGLGMSNIAMSEVFGRWNKGKLDSYLIEITRDILAFETEDGEQTVDMILDTAGQKGTGKWRLMAVLDAGEPLPLIGEAVFARGLSALKDDREKASKLLADPKLGIDVDHLESRFGAAGATLARRVHHPFDPAANHQRGLSARSGYFKPTARSARCRNGERGAGALAQCGDLHDACGHCLTGDELGPVVL